MNLTGIHHCQCPLSHVPNIDITWYITVTFIYLPEAQRISSPKLWNSSWITATSRVSNRGHQEAQTVYTGEIPCHIHYSFSESNANHCEDTSGSALASEETFLSRITGNRATDVLRMYDQFWKVHPYYELSEGGDQNWNGTFTCAIYSDTHPALHETRFFFLRTVPLKGISIYRKPHAENANKR